MNFKTIIVNDDYENIAQAAEIIKSGGLVAFPTETVYGLGANALDPQAARRIYEAKGRPSDNPLIVHFVEPSDAEKYSYTCELYYKLAFEFKFMPGPITVILPKRDCIPSEITSGLDTVAMRVPSHPTARELIKLSGVPIAAPSANASGKPSPTTAAHVIEDLNGRVEMILDGGDCVIGLESTIVKIENDALILLRPGAITYEELRSVCDNVIIGDSVVGKFDGTPLAPGMKYRHYAPDAQVYLLDGADEKVYGFLADKQDCGILCYDEDTELLKYANAVSLGSKYHYAKQAHMLFKCLRDFKNVDVIYARMPQTDGIGLAVYNRLIKAAGFEVVKL